MDRLHVINGRLSASNRAEEARVEAAVFAEEVEREVIDFAKRLIARARETKAEVIALVEVPNDAA